MATISTLILFVNRSEWLELLLLKFSEFLSFQKLVSLFVRIWQHGKSLLGHTDRFLFQQNTVSDPRLHQRSKWYWSRSKLRQKSWVLVEGGVMAQEISGVNLSSENFSNNLVIKEKSPATVSGAGLLIY